MINNMMKKQYIRPALEQMTATTETIIAVSLEINVEAQNGISGDVKESGDWDESWDDE